ncbi:hypothetical protein [Bacteroides pyogenes]|uniref:hypothetical protein n=1 Tax=Bacteroides pyogenes TaxID=310300 RepID=UPI002FD92C3A
MKKIAILSCVNIKHMSLISLYTKILDEHNVKYDIIYMDKYGEDEDFSCEHKYRYVNIINQKWPKFLKKVKYMTYYPYVRYILSKNKYDFVIVWNDLAIFMFANYLSKHYKGKYCLNVRDNMYYDSGRYQSMYERCFNRSKFNTVSSRGYLSVLPKDPEYIQINSLNLSVLDGMKVHTAMRTKEETIRIGFVGYVRYYERNQKLLKAFANDSRFELHYYGKNADVLKAFAEAEGIHNTVFHDSFPVADTAKYLQNIDIINNLYGNDTFNVRQAISIKFYHALYSRIPMLVCPDTFIGQQACKLGIGFYVDDDQIDAKMKESLYEWYHNIDFSKLNASCEKKLNEAIAENNIFEDIVIKAICN